MIGVYLLTCKKTGKTYVGASTDVEKRVASHRRSSFRKEAFYNDVLEVCDKESLFKREAHWIEQLESNKPHMGYNRMRGSTTKTVPTLSYAQEVSRYQRMMAKRATGR